MEDRQKDKWGLTTKGASALTTGIVALPLLEGVAHLGPLGMVIAGGLTLVAFRHGDEIASKGKDLLNESVKVPTSRGLGDRMLGRKRNSQIDEINEEQISTPSALRSGDTIAVSQNEITIPLGVDIKGKTFQRTLKQLKSVIILGLQEGGKTNTAIHILRYAVQYGARLAIIDKHARSEEDSMTCKIKHLEACFDCSLGDNPDTSIEVVRHVRNVLDNRIEGAKCDYPLILVVDEFSAIMRQKEEGGKWQECGQMLAGLVEDINMEGRKHKVFCLCIGQITNVSRAGGSEIRELFATRIAHAMSPKQAQLFGFTDEGKDIQRLKKGETMMQTEGTSAFFLKFPYVTEQEIRKIVPHLPKRKVETKVLPLSDVAEEDLLSEREQQYAQVLDCWSRGIRSIRPMMEQLGLNFNQTRELMEEMDDQGLIPWRKNGGV